MLKTKPNIHNQKYFLLSQRFTQKITLGMALMLATGTWADNDEIKEAMALSPNIENGIRIYERCATCHTPMGWGDPRGRYAQIASQHVNVIIKELTNIRMGNRDNSAMYPFSNHGVLGGPQNVADVAAYVTRLPMSPYNQVGPGNDLEQGAKVYKEQCVKCHGENGEGSNEDFFPRIHGQHFSYLVRQFQWFMNGQRHDIDPLMMKKIKILNERDILASADFISRLRPPPELVAPVGWYNPDFQTKFMISPPVPVLP